MSLGVAQSAWLVSPTGGCKRRRWSCSVFGLVPSTQGSVLGLPTSTCLADASVLDATITTAPPVGFSHLWGHRMAASPGQDFLLLGGPDRRRLEAVYTLLVDEGAWPPFDSHCGGILICQILPTILQAVWLAFWQAKLQLDFSPQMEHSWLRCLPKSQVKSNSFYLRLQISSPPLTMPPTD